MLILCIVHFFQRKFKFFILIKILFIKGVCRTREQHSRNYFRYFFLKINKIIRQKFVYCSFENNEEFSLKIVVFAHFCLNPWFCNKYLKFCEFAKVLSRLLKQRPRDFQKCIKILLQLGIRENWVPDTLPPFPDYFGESRRQPTQYLYRVKHIFFLYLISCK